MKWRNNLLIIIIIKMPILHRTEAFFIYNYIIEINDLHFFNIVFFFKKKNKK